MWMVFPNQAAGLQGLLCVDRGALAVKDLGIGSGWQQSRQNWMPAAVVGQRIRMESSGIMYALLSMWMVFPNQAAGLQGFLCVNRDLLAVKDLGIGSGWQQSRQNWMPAAVVG